MELKSGDWIEDKLGQHGFILHVHGGFADYIIMADGKRFLGSANTGELTRIERPDGWENYLPPTK